MSHNEYISKQRQLASMEVGNIDGSIILQEESAFEKKDKELWVCGCCFNSYFLLMFFTVPFVKDRIQWSFLASVTYGRSYLVCFSCKYCLVGLLINLCFIQWKMDMISQLLAERDRPIGVLWSSYGHATERQLATRQGGGHLCGHDRRRGSRGSDTIGGVRVVEWLNFW